MQTELPRYLQLLSEYGGLQPLWYQAKLSRNIWKAERLRDKGDGVVVVIKIEYFVTIYNARAGF